MKIARSMVIFIIAGLVLTFGIARAQTPTQLDWLVIKLWPEYDDPRLLVIVDGKLTNPEEELRLPLPQDAELNAVATADDTGRLIINDWREEKDPAGQRILVLKPEFPVFRIEYYAPLAFQGDQRIIDFELPSGFLQSNDVRLEALLPPTSKEVSLDPPADEQGPTQDDALFFQRTLGALTEQPLRQKITYVNPSGALTVPETASTGALLQPTPPPAEEPANPPRESNSRTPWILLLGGLALALIVGGVVGLWLTREKATDTAASRRATPTGTRKKRPTAPAMPPSQNKLDRFCRNCGKEFGPEDRFCRYCGAKRQTIQ